VISVSVDKNQNTGMVYPPDIYKSVISVFLKKFLKKMAL
jgi:hypothetical protein